MKRSAGILPYKISDGTVYVLLVHPGGPFWAKKDLGSWSMPKGEYLDDEEPLIAAKREFQEELGLPVPEGELIELGMVKVPGKEIYSWYIKADFSPSHVTSNLFEMEWPPRSGKKQTFPEVDRAEWFTLSKATQKIVKGQIPILERLAEKLKVTLDPPEPLAEQASLF
jgi:predicted NUDIX family NTP pyrophosphohydrolase